MAAYRRRIWERLAFVARYGHQPLGVPLIALDLEDLFEFADALETIVKQEARAVQTL